MSYVNNYADRGYIPYMTPPYGHALALEFAADEDEYEEAAAATQPDSHRGLASQGARGSQEYEDDIDEGDMDEANVERLFADTRSEGSATANGSDVSWLTDADFPPVIWEGHPDADPNLYKGDLFVPGMVPATQRSVGARIADREPHSYAGLLWGYLEPLDRDRDRIEFENPHKQYIIGREPAWVDVCLSDKRISALFLIVRLGGIDYEYE